LLTELKSSTAVFNDAGEGSDTLEPHDFEGCPFTLLDTRGLFFLDTLEIREVRNLVDGRFKDFEEIVRKRQEDGRMIFNEEVQKRPAAAFKDQIHGVIFVFKSLDPNLKNGKYVEQYKPIRRFMRSRGMQPIVCITWADKIKDMPDQERAEIRRLAIAATGCDRDRMYQVQNAISDKDEISNATKFEIFNMLYESMVFCERYQLVHDTRVKNKLPLEAAEEDEEKVEPKASVKGGSKSGSGKGITVRVMANEKEVIGSFDVPVGSEMTFQMLKDTIRGRNGLPSTSFFFRDQWGKDVVDGAKIIQQYEDQKSVDLLVTVQ